MPHHEEQFQTGDGLTLYETRWLPEGEVRAVVVFLHGFTEHAGRYGELAETLAGRGFAVWAIDLRGHGKSQGQKVFFRSIDEHLDDLDRLLARVREEFPHHPLFLMGHSMGAAIVLLSAMERDPQAAGVVASAPPVRIGSGVFPLLRHLAAVVGRIFPRLRLVSIGSSMLSRDPEVIDDFRNDPLVYHGRFPVRSGAEVFRASMRIRRGMHRLRLPVLILHGTGDMVTSAKASGELVAAAASTDKTLKTYDGLYHDLVHEPEKAAVMADVVTWLEARADHSAGC